MARRARLAAIILLVLGLAPGTWLRSPVVFVPEAVLVADRLDTATPEGWPAGLELEAGWRLRSTNPDFFGFSALLVQRDGRLRAFNDGGASALFAAPPGAAEMAITPVPHDPRIAYLPDTEAAAQRSDAGPLWLSYEHHNALRRIDPDGSSHLVFPPLMRKWGSNSGGEAMVRLADGRFIVLAEGRAEGVIFAGDPVAGASGTRFTVDRPGDFKPTDMALLPDGRVLVLMRRIAWRLPPFASLLAIADPAAIRGDVPWRLEPLAEIDDFGLRENYEGLAVEERADRALTLWLISDDNRSVLQRTLLLRLRWDYRAEAARP